MKLKNKLACRFSLIILFVGLTGCGSVKRVTPLGGGYQRVSYTQSSISEPEATQISLQYQKPNGGLMMIWPSAGGTIVRNDVAIFLGDKAWKKPPFGERWPMKPRFFAVEAPELPLDITDEIIWRWSKESGKDFEKAKKTAGFQSPKEKNNKLDFYFVFWTTENWPDTAITLDWNQISDIMREVKEKGIVHKDLRWGINYIEKEFKPEIQK